jgi:hypothetical protein
VIAIADWAFGHFVLFSHSAETLGEGPDNVYSLKANCVAVRECGTCEKCKGSSFHASKKAKVSNTD